MRELRWQIAGAPGAAALEAAATDLETGAALASEALDVGDEVECVVEYDLDHSTLDAALD
jgi:hypothetical protein